MAKRLGRRAELITYQERTQTIKEWSKEIGVVRSTLYRRLSSGLPLEDVLYPGMRNFSNPGPSAKRMITALGKTQSVRLWSEDTGLSQMCIRMRLHKGCTHEEAVTLKLHSRRLPRQENAKADKPANPRIYTKQSTEQRLKTTRAKRTRQDAEEVREWIAQAKKFMRGDAKIFTGEAGK